MDLRQTLKEYEEKGCIVPTMSIIKTPEQIAHIREAADLNTRLLDFLTPYIKEGISTEFINTLVYDFTTENGGIPAPLNYQGFPKSVCTSVNNVVCHGIPSEKQILKSGDILNVDVSTIYNGYYADASRMFMIGDVADNARKLVTVTKECVELGLKEVKPFQFIGDMSDAIHSHALKNGFSVIDNIGGHGIGLEFHEEPFVCYTAPKGTEMLMVPGMIFTIEPMLNEGSPNTFKDEYDGWTIYTIDDKLSAQWEIMVLVTEEGAEVLSY